MLNRLLNAQVRDSTGVDQELNAGAKIRKKHQPLGQCQKMLPFSIFLIQRLNNGLNMLLIIQKIGIGGIYDEGFDVVLPNVMCISFLDAKQVFIRDLLLVRPGPLADVFLQAVDRCV